MATVRGCWIVAGEYRRDWTAEKAARELRAVSGRGFLIEHSKGPFDAGHKLRIRLNRTQPTKETAE
jgi:hypothetical protein